MDHAGREASHALSAILLRKLGRDVPQFAHLAHQAAVKHAGPVTLLEARCDARLGKASYMTGKRGQIVIDVGIHV